ncbi:MAG: diacylglycerol kinase family lipid kinase [Clostridia bacterium]|nr:diacylglycerol kinase family lipid kinase [Clostridia bacterium]
MRTFIVNPVAGNGYALQVESMILEKHKAEAGDQVVRTEYPGHATLLAAEAVRNGADTVVAVGGDGTAFEVACGLMGSHAALGIIPAGTGNDFIKSAGIPKDPAQALEKVLHGIPLAVDVCQLNDRMFLNVCGAGFDVTVLDYTVEAKKRFKGIVPYLIGLVKGISHYRPVHVKVTVDGQVKEKKALICAVANGRFFGGGIPICPVADITDGRLNMVLVDHKPRWMIPFYLPALMFGRVLKFRITEHILCEQVEIVSPGMRLQADGEIMTMDKAVISILKGRLHLYC